MYFRNSLFRMIAKILQTPDLRLMLKNSLAGLLHWQPKLDSADYHKYQLPYPELGIISHNAVPKSKDEVIFITGRFRCGSTMLWNIFRNTEGYTAYYEPFNEGCWNKNRRKKEGTDPTHRKVENYWTEYDTLQSTGELFQKRWSLHNLYMDRSFYNQDMKNYIDMLIHKADGIPVLQFNRIDFRLPWFRVHYPNARIIHIYRHPRDQWCSTLRDLKSFPKDKKISDFAAHDRFYLLEWVSDLKYHFPFLEQKYFDHPYQLFYLIWRLSFIIGSRHADISVSLENIVNEPDKHLEKIINSLHLKNIDVNECKKFIVQPVFNKWKDYADDGWFKNHEQVCEHILYKFYSMLK